MYEGQFMYLNIDYITPQWTNWGPEPDGGNDENCVIAFHDDFSWHDDPCDAKHLPLCYGTHQL